MNIKPIPNFPDYFVSDTGIVFSKMQKYRQAKPKDYRRLGTHKCFGYDATHLRKSKKSYKRFIHRLVLETFVKPCPEELQCRHLDGNKSNNNLSNLKWGTRSENQMDRVACGNSNRGERSRMSKLKKEDVIIIRKLATKANKNVRKIDKGGNYKEIAKKFKVSTTAISAIVGRRTWGWLE